MYFELEGKTYRIKFYRDGNLTIAELYEISEETGGMISLGVFGIAAVYYKDRFEKKLGRKVALSHLLKVLSDHVDEDGNFIESVGPIVLDKKDRQMIWDKYFETHRK